MALTAFKKENVLIFIYVTVIVVTFYIINNVKAENIEPGSDADPIVSKSYVDQEKNKIDLSLNQISNDITVIKKQLEDMTNNQYTATSGTGGINIDNLKNKVTDLENKVAVIDNTGKYRILELAVNQVLLCEGSSEIILRSGEAKGIYGQSGGLTDMTMGSQEDLINDHIVQRNHLFLSSKSDGRGIMIISKKALVLIRGGYSIK